MAKRTQPNRKSASPERPWPAVLVAMAAAGREDGGVGLHHLLRKAGFAKTPAMSIIIKRARVDRDGAEDPYVDDVLDALRSLCA